MIDRRQSIIGLFALAASAAEANSTAVPDTLFTVSSANSNVGPGFVMYAEANHLHGVENTGAEPLRFYS